MKERLIIISIPDANQGEVDELRKILIEALKGKDLGYEWLLVNREIRSFSKEEFLEAVRCLQGKVINDE